jgi:hypothetical protein
LFLPDDRHLAALLQDLTADDIRLLTREAPALGVSLGVQLRRWVAEDQVIYRAEVAHVSYAGSGNWLVTCRWGAAGEAAVSQEAEATSG